MHSCRLLLIVFFLFSAMPCIANAQYSTFGGIVSRNEGETLVITVKYKNHRLTENMLGYQNQNGDLLIPFSQFVKLIEVPITVDTSKAIASGKFLEKNIVYMDLASNKIAVNKKEMQFDPDDVERHIDEIYISSSLLAKIFPISISFDMKELTLEISSTEMFPIDIAMQSAQNRKALEIANKDPKVDLYYKNNNLFSAPFIDLSINKYQIKTDGSTQSGNAYSVIARERILGMDGEASVFNASASTSELVRIRMSREFDEPKIGVIKNVSFGDVVSQSFPIAANNTTGRGVSFSSANTSGIADNRTITIEGAIALGWQVELYRNGQLINYITETSNGRYQFSQVQLLLGNNDFKLIFYGPNGQRREEIKKFYLPVGDVINAGRFGFKFSAVQENRYIVESAALKQNVNTQNNQGDVIGILDYGVSDKITASFGLSHINNARTAFLLDDNEKIDQNFIMMGFKTSLFGVGVEYNNVFTQGTNKSPAHYLSLQTTIKNLNLSILHEQYGEIKTIRSLYLNQFLSSYSGFNATSSISIFKYTIPIILSSNIYKSQQGELGYTNSVQTFLSFLRRFNLGLEYQSAQDFYKNNTSFANSRLNTNFGRASIRYEAFYLIKPTKHLNNLRFTTEYRASSKLMLSGRWDRFFFPQNIMTQVDRYTASTSFIMPIGSFRLDTYRERQTKNLGLSLSYTVGITYNPATHLPSLQPAMFGSTGAVVADAFLDKNYNRQYDKGEPLLSDIPINIQSSNKKQSKKGKVFATHIVPYTKQTADVSQEELAKRNITWVMPQKIGFVARPSSTVAVHIPIQEVADVEGTVYFKNKSGKISNNKGIKLYMVNIKGEIVKDVVSDYDGIFLFEKIPFGVYKIMLDEKQLMDLGLTVTDLKQEKPITLNADNPLYYHEGITLQDGIYVPRPKDTVIYQKEEPLDTLKNTISMEDKKDL